MSEDTRKKDICIQRKRKRQRKRKIFRCMRYVLGLISLSLLWMGVAHFAEGVSFRGDETTVVIPEKRVVKGSKTITDEQQTEELPTDQTKTDHTKADHTKTDQMQTDKKQIDATKKQEARRIFEENQELLVLVNKELELSKDYDPGLRSICNGRLKASERLYDALTDMLRAGKEAGYQFWIASAYRSRQWQKSLVDSDVRKYMKQGLSESEAMAKTLEQTMPPGHSEHETGLALDILCSDNLQMDVSQEQSPGNIWLREHCYEYGFILRYPEEKEEITEISYEPWHLRYVGKDAALFMKEYDLTLEEFWHVM